MEITIDFSLVIKQRVATLYSKIFLRSFGVHPANCIHKWGGKKKRKKKGKIRSKSTRTIELGTSFFENSRAIGIAIIFLVEPSVNRDKGSGQTIERYAAGEGEEGGEGSASM